METMTQTAAHVGMSPAKLRVAREYLGLTGDALADHLGVQLRSYQRWEAGTHPIPDGVRAAIEDLEDAAAQSVTQAVRRLVDLPDPAVVTYLSDGDYHAAHPDEPWPASYHRAIIARVAQQVPGLSIDYA